MIRAISQVVYIQNVKLDSVKVFAAAYRARLFPLKIFGSDGGCKYSENGSVSKGMLGSSFFLLNEKCEVNRYLIKL